MQDRINQLENLVLTLMQQQTGTDSPEPLSDFSPKVPGRDAYLNNEEPSTAARSGSAEVPPSPSDYGSMRIRKSSVSYVSSSHWAAVLDSIAGLRDQFEQEDEVHAPISDPPPLQFDFPKPQLLYGCPTPATRASVLESIPPRAVVDRLVSRYFNVLDMDSGKCRAIAPNH